MSRSVPIPLATRELKIGDVRVDPPLVLAPMAGITDRDFRLLLRRIGGVGLVTMEFVSSRAIVEGHRDAERILVFCEEERPLSIQIYGSDAATMAEAARQVEELGPDVCDINMGCPANKVLKNCAGVRLMGNLKLAREIVREVRRALSIPLTVKFRLGLDDSRKSYLELGRICEGEGVDAVAMHGRTAKQMFRGEARWEEIARLKEAVSIPVLGNGDVTEPEDAVEMLRTTGCDGVLIGRGATRNPWLFRQIAARLSGGRVEEPTLEDRRRLIQHHFRTVVGREEPVHALHKLRVFTRWYSQGLPRGLHLRRRINDLPDPETFLGAVEEFFDGLSALDAAA
jgi:tRNA-dihydrouridine synthase B